MELVKKIYFKRTLLFIALVELFSVFAFIIPDFRIFAFSIILMLTLVLSLIDLKWGLYLACTELLIGSFGRLFWLECGETEISFRIGIFLIIMSVWLTKSALKAVKEKNLSPFLPVLPKKIKKWLYWLGAILLMGLFNGLIQNKLENVFFDFNNWLFFLYFLPFSQEIKTREDAVTFASIFTASLLWLTIKSLTLLYLFSHNAIGTLEIAYRWVRDSGIGEITRTAGSFYRIFLQSQIFSLL